MTKHIFWLASYPKSGNTLLRAVLSSLFFTENGVFDLKLLESISQFETTFHVSKIKKLIGNDFNKIRNINVFYKYLLKLQEKEILGYQEDFKFYKTHSGNFAINNNFFTSEKNIRGIIYMIRDPRDVCISWANHTGKTYDQSIEFMLNDFQSLLWMKGENELFDENNIPLSFIFEDDMNIVPNFTTDIAEMNDETKQQINENLVSAELHLNVEKTSISPLLPSVLISFQLQGVKLSSYDFLL